jgi:hypothetical protein
MGADHPAADTGDRAQDDRLRRPKPMGERGARAGHGEDSEPKRIEKGDTVVDPFLSSRRSSARLPGELADRQTRHPDDHPEE